MPGMQRNQSDKPYLRIVGGTFVQKVEEGTAGAKIRKWENTKTGEKGETLEISYINWTAKILGITFKDTEYGEVAQVEMEDCIISLNVESRYFSDFACKIFNVDLTEKVTLHPYSMEIDGKKKSGISVQQHGEKALNYFYDGKQNLHGFPVVDESKKEKKTYWKGYFLQVTEFLIDKVKELQFPKPEVSELNMNDPEQKSLGNSAAFEEFLSDEPDTGVKKPF